MNISRLFIDPESAAAKAARALRPTDPVGASFIDVIARRPVATWIGDWVQDVAKYVDEKITEATEAMGGAFRVFVVYNIPRRDCGNFSASDSGKMPNEYEYSKFIAQIALGAKGRKALYILEPDALAVTHCLDSKALQSRMAAMASAAGVLAAAGGQVFIDAGCFHWIPNTTMATRLIYSGIHAAIQSGGGFALNVSHFETTANSHAYASDLRLLLPKAKYVIDTSRNGLGPSETEFDPEGDPEWCNPSGRALGNLPTLMTRALGCYAYLWVKTPGSSDGLRPTGAPKAGDYWPSYAIGLVERSPYKPKT